MATAFESFVTGAANQGAKQLQALATRNREKKKREERRKAGQEYFAAMQEYQTKGTPISPEQASLFSQHGYNVPQEALRGFDLSALEGGGGAQQITGAAPGGATPGSTGAPQGGGLGPSAQAFQAGALGGPEAIVGAINERGAAVQAKNRQFAMDQLHETQERIGKKAVRDLTTDEFIELSQRWWAVDKPRARQLANQYRTPAPTSGPGKPASLNPDEINEVRGMIDGGAFKREHFTTKQWEYIDDLWPTAERKRLGLKHKFDVDTVLKRGNQEYQSEQAQLWPFGGSDSDLAKWSTGEGASLTKPKRDFFGKYHLFGGEKDTEAIAEVGVKSYLAGQEVIDKWNAPEETKTLMMTLLQATKEELRVLDWGLINEELPVGKTLEEFKAEFIKAYRETYGITPEIP